MYAKTISLILLLTLVSCLEGDATQSTPNGASQTSSDGVIPLAIPKEDISAGARLSVSPALFDFGLRVINTEITTVFTFQNTGTDSLIDCQTPVLTGDNNLDFSIAVNSCNLERISSSQICAVSIKTNSKTIGVKKANLEFECRDNKVVVELNLFSKSTLSGCPDNYHLIPADLNIGSTAFCAMAFEAKNDGTNNVLSSHELTPWVNISAKDAKKTCQSLGTGFDLISNNEWMALARNIEAQAENWDSGIVNTGCLFRGNAGEEDNCTYNGGKVEFGIERSAKAGHLTSEGDTIWDLSGNLYEFVDWGANTDFTKTPAIDMSICNSADEWQEFTDLLPLLATCSGIIANDYSPNDQSLNSTHKLGQIFLSNEGHAIRGGSWRTVALTAGIFNLNLSSDGSRNSLIGFRCVYRP